MDEERATLLIGLPTQVLALRLEYGNLAQRVLRRLHTIVLCSDHAPQSLAERIRCTSGCEIYEHYGSTEMGLGGGVDCRAYSGSTHLAPLPSPISTKSFRDSRRT